MIQQSKVVFIFVKYTDLISDQTSDSINILKSIEFYTAKIRYSSS